MSILGWGKCLIEYANSEGGVPVGAWKALDTPKENTTKITPTAGTEVTATEEGGDVVDSRTGKNSFTFEFDLFVKKGIARPFEDNDGVILGEYAFRITGEDKGAPGSLIERCSLRVEESYSTADGKILHYVGKCLKPATGRILKEYVANSLVLDKTKLYFGAGADNTGKVVTATATGNVAATKDSDWITVTTSGKTVTIKVTANDTGDLRVGYVTVSADGKSARVEVSQIPS